MDRNVRQVVHIHTEVPSLSARRAWIEMPITEIPVGWWKVALRKESVDRNTYPSQCRTLASGVALRKESVDRNTNGSI